MKKFIKKAMEKAPKLGKERLITLMGDIFSEYQQLETVLNSIPIATIVADKQDRIIYVNKSAIAKIPFRNYEIIEKNLFDIIDDFDISIFLANSIGSGDSRSQEFIIAKDDKDLVLEINVVPLVANGAIQGNIVLADDITEQKELDIQLKRAEKLASLTTLTAGVAHEIKNPLGSISIHIQLIQKLLKGDLDDDKIEKINKFLLVVNEEIDRLNSIIVDFLFTVRPMNLSLEPINMNNLLADLVEFMHYECEKQNIVCDFSQAENLPLVRADIKYLKQAVLNIVKNAIAAMPSGGTLKVATLFKNSKVFIEFQDSGTGIPQEELEKIFEPYFTTKDSGSGLGLTVVYKLVKEMKGEINIDSELGKGTRVTLSFPVENRSKILLEYNATHR
ncbi:MAG: PAS domain S-box protein [Spirochaetales bacterium]|nr:PAS domain S-box protein [Spirochaetales bacterium]